MIIRNGRCRASTASPTMGRSTPDQEVDDDDARRRACGDAVAGYLRLLVLAAVIGAPIAATAYGFLWLVDELQDWFYTDLPQDLGFDRQPTWWPLPLLALAGLLVGLTIRYLPGKGGESPADGFTPGRPPPTPIELPSVFLAALAGLSLGVVIGPEAPLIALGGGLGVCAVRLAARDAPPQTETVIAAAGSFSAISTLLGSPCWARSCSWKPRAWRDRRWGSCWCRAWWPPGVGSLIFVGLDAWTGLGTFSLAIPDLPAVGPPPSRSSPGPLRSVCSQPWSERSSAGSPSSCDRMSSRAPVLLTPVVGLAIAGLAIAFAEGTDESSSLVLFSGQSALGPILDNAASYSVGTLVLLIVCKGLAYSLALSAFRGGPIFPAMFIGAVGGVALSHLPGLGMIAGAAMGIGAMTAAMLRLPMTSVLLATLLLLSSGLRPCPW